METIQETAAEQWNLALSQLRQAVPQAVAYLQDLETVMQTSYHSAEMGPEEWSEQGTDLEFFILPGEQGGISPEKAVCRVFELVRSALDAGDRLVSIEEF